MYEHLHDKQSDDKHSVQEVWLNFQLREFDLTIIISCNFMCSILLVIIGYYSKYKVLEVQQLTLICNWPTFPGSERGLGHKQEMPPKPAQSWYVCCLLLVWWVEISGPWRGHPHRLQVRSVETWKGTKTFTISLRWTHTCRHMMSKHA